ARRARSTAGTISGSPGIRLPTTSARYVATTPPTPTRCCKKRTTHRRGHRGFAEDAEGNDPLRPLRFLRALCGKAFFPSPVLPIRLAPLGKAARSLDVVLAFEIGLHRRIGRRHCRLQAHFVEAAVD